MVFVDTEEEFDWTLPISGAARSVAAIAALPAMHHRLVAAEAHPVYLVDHPVATDPRAVETIATLLGDGRSTVGTQLHPWVSPPFSGEESFAGNLPRDLEAAKIDALTAAIRRAFGRSPIVYRAGRYGIGPNTFDLLAERGYRIDTSMRARFDYRSEGGVDFRATGDRAFRAGPAGRLIELPLTTVFTGALRRAGPRLHPMLGHVAHARGIFARTRLLSRVPLTPEGVPVAEALEAIRIALGEGGRLLTISFHSPSLVPGNTPYVRDAMDLRRFETWWDRVLDLLAREGVRATSPEEVVVAAR